MKGPDPTIERSPSQKRLRIEKLRLELADSGYSVVRSEWLRQMLKRLPMEERVEAIMEAR